MPLGKLHLDDYYRFCVGNCDFSRRLPTSRDMFLSFETSTHDPGVLHSEYQSIPSTFCIGNPIVNEYAPGAPTSDFSEFSETSVF